MVDRNILGLVENDPDAAAEVHTLIEQGAAEPLLRRDYRDRPRLNDERIKVSPTRKQVAWFIGGAFVTFGSWYLIAVAFGLAWR